MNGLECAAQRGLRVGTKLAQPERKRCYACRKFFGFAVYDELYCSRECAQLPVGWLLLDEAPRTCWSWWKQLDGTKKRDWKVRYDSEQDARKRCPFLASEVKFYHCPNCHGWHFGRDRTSPKRGWA